MKTKLFRSFWSALLSVGCLAVVSAAGADVLDRWHWRNPTPFANSLRSICFGSGKFVAVGDGGIIHTSLDGLVWDDGRRSGNSLLRKVIFANSQFVAVGRDGAIMTSADGYVWTSRASGTTNSLYAVAYGNGKYVAVGQNGQLVISNDGVGWQLHSVGTTDLKWIAFGNGVFVVESPGKIIVGSDEKFVVRVSVDGLTWVDVALPTQPNSSFGPNELYEVAFANGTFVAGARVGYQEPPFTYLRMRFFRSSDGTNWVAGAYNPQSGGLSTGGHRFLTHANDAFYEWTYTSGSGVAYTTNGTEFSLYAGPNAEDEAAGIIYSDSRYVLAGLNGKVWTSSTGKSWTERYGGHRNELRRVIRGADRYFAVGNGAPVLTSPDGVAFSAVAGSPTLAYGDIGFDGSNYVSVAAGGALHTSSNGTSWIPRTSNTGNSLSAVARGPARWVAVGQSGTIITSPNTLAWTLRNSGTANHLNGVAYGNGIYVAVGDGGTIVSSPDAATWDVQISETTQSLLNVRYLGGQFYAVGANGTILSSLDGAIWQSKASGVTRALRDICAGDGRLVACGFDYYAQGTLTPINVLLQSTNGTDWADITSRIPSYFGLESISFLGGSFWVCGQNGAILQSDSTDGLPRLTGTMSPDNTAFQLKITLNAPTAYRIQASTNLQSNSWEDLANISNPVSPFIWADTTPPSPARFYRVVSP